MKIIIYIYQLLSASLVPGLLFILLFDQSTSIFLLVLLGVVFTVLFIYSDKIILNTLGARETIDSEYPRFFQYLKNYCYHQDIKVPKVYLYSGDKAKAFVLESRGLRTLLIERSLIVNIGKEQAKFFIKYLMELSLKSYSWKFTKACCAKIVYVSSIDYFLQNIVFVKRRFKLYRALSFFILIIFKPLLSFMLLPLKSGLKQACDKELEEFVLANQDNSQEFSILDYAFLNLNKTSRAEKLLVSIVESDSVFSRAYIGAVK